MERIGIVTYYDLCNYGSVLQAYALSTVINDLGYEAQILDYTNESQSCFKKIKGKTYFNRVITCLKSPRLLSNTSAVTLKNNKFVADISDNQKILFKKFIDNNLKLSNVNILKDDGYFKGYVCGSDQIWQISVPGLHEFYYLRFTIAQKRIAYAPSFGSLSVPRFNEKRLKKYLSEFLALSVREDSGKEIVEQLIGKKIPQVLDPVLLIEPYFWKKFIKKYDGEKYIAGYFLGDISNYANIIEEIEKSLNAKVILIDSGRKQKIDRAVKLVSPDEFVSFIANSDYVITDSLHGTEFSIVFEKSFTVLERNYITIPEQNTRLKSLLNLVKLQDRYVNMIKKDINLKKIDYKQIKNILSNERILSIKYLSDALKKLK